MKSLEAIHILKLGALTVISGLVTYLFSRLVVDTRPHAWVTAFGIISFYATFALGLTWLVKGRIRFSKGAARLIPKGMFTWELLWTSFVLVTFSFGVFYVVHYPLSFWAPQYVEWVLLESDQFVAMDSFESFILNAGLAVTVIFLGPLVEEFVFRGILYQKWKAKLGHWPSLVLVSLIFGALHFDMIGGFVFSVAMITLMVKAGTLAAPLMCHVAYNAFVILGVILTALFFPEFTWTLHSLRSTVWVGAAALAVSLPFVVLLFIRNYRYLKGGA